MRVNEDFPLKFYGLDPHSQVIVEPIHFFREKAGIFARRRTRFSRSRAVGEVFESLKARQFLINVINKLIEVSSGFKGLKSREFE